MKNYLAVDSGGTKVLAVLYDESFTPAKVCRTGSLRENTTPPDLINRNLDTLVQELGLAGIRLECVTGIIDAGLIGGLQERGVEIGAVKGCDEVEAGLAAAGIFGNGLMALSGTGATMFGVYNGNRYYLGGYGASVADDGSGYWLARNAFGAAIKATEGRGPDTMLVDLIARRFGCPGDLRNAVFRIYGQPGMAPVACVASCAPLVSIAAEAGDEVALKLLEETGRVLGEQLAALVRIQNLPKDLPLTISGSVWRSHRKLFDEFARTLRESGLSEVTIPRFEPIVGVIIRHYYELHGQLDEETGKQFQNLYKSYAFSISK